MKAFFDYVREKLFNGSLSQPQVDGLNTLIATWSALGGGGRQQLAYVLATAYHETAATMQPIAEYGHGAGHDYGKIDESGKAPYGRGYVQLTFRANYLKADVALHLNGALAANYDLAMQPDIAAKIIILGMKEGWFTGKKLSDYISATQANFIGARAIVNGADRAALIAGYATEFNAALALEQPVPMAPPPGTPLDAPAKPVEPVPIPPKPSAPPSPAKPSTGSLGAALLAILTAIINLFRRTP